MEPPAHLSAQMKKFWRDVEARYVLETQHRHILELACEQFDRAQAAREQIAIDGMVLAGERHPLLGVEAKATELFYRGVKELGLDSEAVLPLNPTQAGRRAAEARWRRETQTAS